MGVRPGVIAGAFTAAYFAAAFVFGPLVDQGSRIRLGRILLSFFAGLSAIVLWFMYAVCRARRARRTALILAITGALCPFVLTLGTFGALKAAQDYRERRTARQLSASRLSDIHDEPLLGLHGHPIGVHVTYTVTYEQGLSDDRYSLFATVHVDQPAANLLPYSGASRSTRSPGVYRFTEDFTPLFVPLANSRGPCFRWSNEKERAAALESPPQQYQIFINPYRSDTRTANYYAFKTFYEGALAEGIQECK